MPRKMAAGPGRKPKLQCHAGLLRTGERGVFTTEFPPWPYFLSLGKGPGRQVLYDLMEER